ncbi:MAG: hypothetical protein HRU09_06365 [Oligoflexales bacterium]|nr:hypothetical protein [Oligoflexales bacterium]
MKLAISVCPNDIFVFSGLLLNRISHELEISVYPIGKLNELLSAESFDFIKASSIALISNKSYRFLRVGASLARDKGPQLVRRKKSVSESILGVPSLASTGALLAKKYFPHLEQQVFPLAELSGLLMSGDISYGLIINEDMNRLETLGLESICDLGLRWNEEHKALLPLGLFGAHNKLSDSHVDAFEKQVNESILWAREHIDEAISLSQSYAGEASVNADHIQHFTKDAHLNPKLTYYVDKLKNSLNLDHSKEYF